MDSVRHRLDTATRVGDKIDQLLELSKMSVDRSAADEYAGKMIELAQMSRDQRLIAQTYLRNADRYMDNSVLSDNLAHAQKNLKQAEQVAQEKGFEDILVSVYCDYARISHFQGNDVKALAYSTQATSTAAGTDSDSAKVYAYCTAGEIYSGMNQMLPALRNYLNGLDIAEKNGQPDLLRYCYSYLRYFYSAIGEYDKSIDYALKVYDEDRIMWSDDMAHDLLQLGDIFLQKDQPDLASKMYEESIRTADTLRFELLKVNAYHRLFLLYLKTHQYEKGRQFLAAHPDMVNIMHQLGFDFYIGELMAVTYTNQGRYDSAGYYFRKAEPETIAKGIPDFQIDFFMDYADYFKKTMNLPQAIASFNKAFSLAAAADDLNQEERSTDSLKKLYVTVGNYPAALECEQRAAVERDSIRTQLQTTDLMKLEVENDGRRRERLAREEEVRVEHRHNVQYMGFTMGLVALFVGLVMLARLSVPVWLIRALVFVAFIFLFEFVIMLADKQIQGWTAEEPWKVLLLKILLAAGMVPLHHWLERKVVLFLSRHKKGSGPAAPAKPEPDGALREGREMA